MQYIKSLLSLSLLFFVLGCGERAAEPKPVSPGQAAVNQHLDVGGAFYMYADVTEAGNLYRNFAQRAVGGLMQEGMPPVVAGFFAPIDEETVAHVLDELGLQGINAIGASSVLRENGQYRNSSFIHIPGGRSGVLKVLGGEPQPFSSLALATADTDLLVESEFDAGALAESVVRILKVVGNEMGHAVIDGWLSQPAGDTGMTMKEALGSLPNRSVVYLRLGDPVDMPGLAALGVPMDDSIAKMKVPVPELAFQVANLDPKWISVVEEGMADAFTAETEGDITWYVMSLEAPMPEGLSPAFALRASDGSLFATTSVGWLRNLLSGDSARLKSTAAFKQAMDGLPAKGNQLLYLSPRLFSELADFRNAVIDAQPMAALFFGLYGFQLPILLVDAQQHAAASVTANLPDGILKRANWPLHDSMFHSMMGQEQAVVGVGLMAAMAIPAFNKVREQSQVNSQMEPRSRETAVLSRLRQVASAGMQHILSEGVRQVTYDQLLEAGYFRPLTSVDGEDYSQLVVVETGGVLAVELADGTVVEYTY